MSSAAAVAKRVDAERLSALAERFRVWQNRDKHSIFKMPSYLWDDAFKLIDTLGVRQVARELGVEREEFKRRLQQARMPAASIAGLSEGPAAADLPQHEGAASAIQADVESDGDVDSPADVPRVRFVDIDLELPDVLPTPPPPPAEALCADALPAVTPAPDPLPAPPLAAASPAPAEEHRAESRPASGASTAAPSADEAFLEVLDTDGVKLSIRIPVAHLMSVSALIRDFRSRP